jgi:hypothetical protein
MISINIFVKKFLFKILFNFNIEIKAFPIIMSGLLIIDEALELKDHHL